MPKKLTQKEAKAKDPIEGPWLIGEYKGSNIKTEYQCPICHVLFNVMPDSVWRQATKSCGIHRQITVEEANQRDIEAGFEIPVDPYISARQNRKYKCPDCGQLFLTLPQNVWRGLSNRCCKCGYKKRIDATRFTLKEAVEKSDKVGIKLVSGYIDTHTNADFECPVCKKIFKSNPLNIWRKCSTKCKYCAAKETNAKKATITNIEDSFGYKYPDITKDWDVDNNNITPYDVYPASNKKINWKCYKCGYRWCTSLNHRTGHINTKGYGTGCPKCNESKGEKKISEILDRYNIKYERQKRFKNCRHIKPLPFDFYLVESDLLIEYHGIQHYNISSYQFLNKNTDSFKQLQQRDKIKKDYAIQNHKFLEISYKDFANIEKILQEVIKC